MNGLMTISVRVLGGESRSLQFTQGATLSEVLSASEVSVDGMQVRVNGRICPVSQALNEGDIVLLSPRVETAEPEPAGPVAGSTAGPIAGTRAAASSTITVRVGKLPGKLKDVELPAGATVGQAISEGLSVTDKLQTAVRGYEVRLNGEQITNLDTPVANDDQVFLIKPVVGN